MPGWQLNASQFFFLAAYPFQRISGEEVKVARKMMKSRNATECVQKCGDV